MPAAIFYHYFLFVIFYSFPAAIRILLLCYSHHCDVRVYTLIPVQEALHIDGLAHLQSLYCIVYVCRIVAQIGLYAKGIGLSVVGSVKIHIVPI